MKPSFRALVLAGALLAAPSASRAESARAASYDAHDDRLAGLREDELSRLSPELAQGPVALVEFADVDAGQLPAVNIALGVRAKASSVTELIADPARYPSFMRTVDSVEVIEARDGVVVYDWGFDLALLRMRGRNVMTVLRPPPERAKSAARITIDSEHGDFGRGRLLFRVHPRDSRSCVLVLSMRLDLREANYVARQMAKAARSINRSANLSLAFSMALHLRKEAERRAGTLAAPRPPAPLQAPALDVRRLAPLLGRGDLVFLDLAGDRLDRLWVAGFVQKDRAAVHAAMVDAQSFGSALMPGSAAKVVAKAGGVTTFDWNIDMPLVGVSGRMRMSERPPEVAIDATDGALAGGRWRFALHALGKHMTLVTGWARFDFKNSTFLLEKLIAADPYLGHGITAASEVMLVRAIRSRAEKP